jgi:hypothetical protein
MNEMKQNSIKLRDAHFIYQSKTKSNKFPEIFSTFNTTHEEGYEI